MSPARPASSRFLWPALGALLLAAAPFEDKPHVLRTHAGAAEGARFGGSVSAAGDVNADGFGDVIIGAPGGAADTGLAFVYEGHKGELLHELAGAEAGDRFGHVVNDAGDVDNDGFADVIVGSPGAHLGRGRVQVFSGQDGEVLFDESGEKEGDQYGWSASGCGDADQDGFADFVVGAPGRDDKSEDSGLALVYSGKKGKLLHTLKAEGKGEQVGWCVSGAGDVNNDGFGDVAVGAPRGTAKKGEKGATGVVRLYHGKKGALLHELEGAQEGDRFGNTVNGAGDVDNDGYSDVIVGTGVSPGYVRVVSGKTEKVLHQFDPRPQQLGFGWAVGGAGDVNGDTYADVVIGIPGEAEGATPAVGRVQVYSGKTGDMLLDEPGAEPGDGFGAAVAGAGDLDNDSFTEVLVGAERGSGKGYVRIYTLK